MQGADGGARLVGELATTDPLAGGRFESEFEYAPEWSADPTAFPIDPVSLPLRTRDRFRAEQFDPPLSVFDDALPDDWGRRLLTHALKAEGRQPYPPRCSCGSVGVAQWLAKVPSRMRDGAQDVVGLEATCLDLARRGGLSVPDSRLQSVGRQRVEGTVDRVCILLK
jgi:hypothetical protein